MVLRWVSERGGGRLALLNPSNMLLPFLLSFLFPIYYYRQNSFQSWAIQLSLNKFHRHTAAPGSALHNGDDWVVSKVCEFHTWVRFRSTGGLGLCLSVHTVPAFIVRYEFILQKAKEKPAGWLRLVTPALEMETGASPFCFVVVLFYCF